jgi:hypothetical protein
MKLLTIALLLVIPSIASAQSIHDPVPIQGNMVTETARASAMYSAGTYGLGAHNGGRRTAAQSAQRLVDLENNKACRARALQYPSGHKMRRAIRNDCEARFNAAREYWK